jgi:hypothetical protein
MHRHGWGGVPALWYIRERVLCARLSILWLWRWSRYRYGVNILLCISSHLLSLIHLSDPCTSANIGLFSIFMALNVHPDVHILTYEPIDDIHKVCAKNCASFQNIKSVKSSHGHSISLHQSHMCIHHPYVHAMTYAAIMSLLAWVLTCLFIACPSLLYWTLGNAFGFWESGWTR